LHNVITNINDYLLTHLHRSGVAGQNRKRVFMEIAVSGSQKAVIDDNLGNHETGGKDE